MSGMKVVIDHGDKLAVALIALGLGWWTVSAIIDPEIQPSVTATDVRSQIEDVEQALRDRKKPNFREFEDVQATVASRLSIEAPSVEMVTGITDHPDITAQAGDILVVLSGYVIGQPTLSLQNKVGSMTLTAVMPVGDQVIYADDGSDSEARVKDGLSALWEREILGKKHVNEASVQGLFIELAVGEDITKDSWRPLNAGKVRNGVLLTTESQVSVQVGQLEQWAKYHFRASLLVSATAPEAGKRPVLGREVYVFDEKIPWSMIGLPEGEQLTNGRFEQLVEQAEQGRDIRLAKPSPAGFTVKTGQSGFQGRASAVVAARALSDTTVALMKVTSGLPPGAQFGDPDVEMIPYARIAINKRLPEIENMEWAGAQEALYSVGQRVGSIMDIIDPDGNVIPADLTTPWKVVEIKPDVERTMYYEVKLGSVFVDGQAVKKFGFTKKPKRVHVVVLENVVSGSRVELTELLRQILVTPGRKWVTPPFPLGKKFAEQDAFRANPVDFRDPPLEPTPPKLHGDTLLISRLIKNQLIVKTSVSLPYVEMPEGYLLYYDMKNKEVKKLDIPPGLRSIRPDDMMVENEAAEPAAAAAGEVPAK